MLTDTDAALGTTWVVDPERSTVGFNIAHFGVATVKGRFGAFAGTLGIHRGVVSVERVKVRARLSLAH